MEVEGCHKGCMASSDPVSLKLLLCIALSGACILKALRPAHINSVLSGIPMRKAIAYTSSPHVSVYEGALSASLELQLLHAGHAYAAAISACAAGSVWPRAVELFDEMMEVNIKPDVVSCTALISALGSDAQWERAERVIVWMHQVRIATPASIMRRCQRSCYHSGSRTWTVSGPHETCAACCLEPVSAVAFCQTCVPGRISPREKA